MDQAERDAATFFEGELSGFTGWNFDSEQGSRIRQPEVVTLPGLD